MWENISRSDCIFILSCHDEHKYVTSKEQESMVYNELMQINTKCPIEKLVKMRTKPEIGKLPEKLVNF